MSTVKIPAILANIPLFREMSPEEIERIAAGTRELHLARGDVLFQRGDPSTGFYVVIHGQVKLALTSPQGIEKVVELFGPGQSFGEAVMFMGKPYPVYAQTLTDSLTLHISKNVVLGGIDSDPAFCRKMLAGLSIRLHRLIHYVESFSLRSSAQRVIGYLLQDLEEVQQGQDIQISLPANKNVIASNLNITPETFSRILHNLSDDGLIEVKGKDVLIKDIARLRAYDE
ncbi:Crp/Fnr family transcriptional regulator [Sulfurimicrobium lacus]|uniref:Crp/Fnr family transcriptional regulator n=1 Tax=Sulfurimicrobium lacus TaxID=2715678 RepID=A0A6F8VEE6_9PROT|nr:Crp/Fnr family transcriptional regulator [Sulfurimicrobium lacus]BCB28088.1 Crp/Fnr family transcriptional regulator [Sulfurimicrobium lacus]